jgi:hypothetical protein
MSVIDTKKRVNGNDCGSKTEEEIESQFTSEQARYTLVNAHDSWTQPNRSLVTFGCGHAVADVGRDTQLSITSSALAPK